ncbi:SDR family NAD(P)-dependent oxidoreductase [Aquipuribacter sp. MA13-6]|uniref:SDR family NAD(P)-dependent oxidoreductase n=1 Tax=unclassified Aquipuribacter TaxID=2635084 RepID=UPI003EEDDAB3
MTWTLADAPPQHGRVAVVTGASSGLGLEAAVQLTATGAHVVLACRDAGRGARALEQVHARTPGASAEVSLLDVASPTSVRAFAERTLDQHPRLDLVLANAGIMAVPQERTVDGFELQLGTNHLGHFALLARLWPAVRGTAGARVLQVTSVVRHTGAVPGPADLDPPRYGPWTAYARSKTACAVTGVELDRRIRSGPGEHPGTVASVLAHPGFTHTDLQHRSAREQGGLAARFFSATVRSQGMPVHHGVLPLLRAVLDPTVTSGQMVAPRLGTHGPPVVRRPERRLRDPRAGQRLWALSEQATGVTWDV